MKEIVSINKELCSGCGVCIKICPQQILYMDKETGTCSVTEQEKCDKLRGCERKCPTGAIKIN
ncbi:MAG: 4Fe-4S binding protein [Dehalococcoidales bacterium]